MVAGKEGPYNGNATDGKYAKIKIGGFNVDIMYSIVGGLEPPELPLRQELNTQGIEMVYNAKGVGNMVVCKQQHRREALLLEKLKRIEIKLESKKSYRQTSKREKALSMIRELRIKMEHCARTISYEMYLEELRKLKDPKSEDDDEDTQRDQSQFTNQDGSVNTTHVENQIQQALEMLNDSDSEIHLSDGESLDYTNNTVDDSLLSEGTIVTAEITDTSMESYRGHNEERESATSSLDGEKIDGLDNMIDLDKDGEEDTKSSFWKTAGLESGAFRTSASGTTFVASNMNKRASLNKQGSSESFSSVMKSPSSSSVRFKDVKPSLEDNLARARALIDYARVVKRNFSYDSNCSSIKPSDSYVMGGAPKQLVDLTTFESERFHLFVTHACPWSHRTLLVRSLKGLEGVIGVSYIKCSWKPQPLWDTTIVANPDSDVSFWSIDKDNAVLDDDGVFKVFNEIYLSEPNSCIKVPVLWDKKMKRVVGNTSAEIMWMLNFDFNNWAKRPKVNLFPAGKKQECDQINRLIHGSLSVGVYQCGLATSQNQYDDAIRNLTETLETVDSIVRKRGFLGGSKLTASDVRLFSVLIRMDEIYRVLFHTNTRRISSMPGIMEYVKDIYHVKGVKDVCDINAMKKEYFSAMTEKDRDFIIPRGGIFMKLLDAEA